MDYIGLVQVAVLLYYSILVVIAGCSATHLTLTVHCGGGCEEIVQTAWCWGHLLAIAHG